MTIYVGEQPADEDLAAGFRHDPELFTKVYDRYLRDIYRYVAGRVGVQVADDLAADVFLVAFRQRRRFDPTKGGLRPWLFGIATNLVARYRRAEARHYRAVSRTELSPVVDSHENAVVTSVAAERVRPQLMAALSALSAGERDVVLLVALSQLTHEEVAQALGISYGTVGSRLSRARKKLQNAMNKGQFDG